MGTKKEMELSTFGRAYMHSDENFALMGLSSSADIARPKEKKWMIMKMIKKKGGKQEQMTEFRRQRRGLDIRRSLEFTFHNGGGRRGSHINPIASRIWLNIQHWHCKQPRRISQARTKHHRRERWRPGADQKYLAESPRYNPLRHTALWTGWKDPRGSRCSGRMDGARVQRMKLSCQWDLRKPEDDRDGEWTLRAQRYCRAKRWRQRNVAEYLGQVHRPPRTLWLADIGICGKK